MPLTLATWNINSVRLRIDQVARFVAEARAVGQLSHPGIVDLFEHQLELVGAAAAGIEFPELCERIVRLGDEQGRAH